LPFFRGQDSADSRFTVLLMIQSFLSLSAPHIDQSQFRWTARIWKRISGFDIQHQQQLKILKCGVVKIVRTNCLTEAAANLVAELEGQFADLFDVSVLSRVADECEAGPVVRMLVFRTSSHRHHAVVQESGFGERRA